MSSIDQIFNLLEDFGVELRELRVEHGESRDGDSGDSDDCSHFIEVTVERPEVGVLGGVAGRDSIRSYFGIGIVGK